MTTMTDTTVLRLDELTAGDVALVGGKNASLGEMIRHLAAAGIRVPEGFATTAAAYREFLEVNDLTIRIAAKLKNYRAGRVPLTTAGKTIRGWMRHGKLPRGTADAIRAAYRELCERAGEKRLPVAVRSSATAEDLPEASFAGQHETFLNVRGEEALLEAVRGAFASLFTDRAIAYRDAHGFDHMKVALSAGVQRMVRADKAGAGVMFTLDTDSGFPRVVLIDANWGLGETVVQGTVDPDEYLVFKPLLEDERYVPIIHKARGRKERKVIYGPSADRPTRTVETSARERSAFVLTDPEVVQLARWAVAVEEHYGRPMDLEWARDGMSGELYVVQARPETVQARREAGALRSYTLGETGRKLLTGVSIGDAVAAGRVCRLDDPAAGRDFPEGGILVTRMTDPDWVPVMKRAAAIVTDHGGRTSHAAIVSRELGLPAVIGTARATEVLEDGMEVTVSCAEGDEGNVYEGVAEFHVEDLSVDDIPDTRTKVMLNLANPAAALRWWRLPADGVGLARIEFIISDIIRVHPLALTRFDELDDRHARAEIERLTAGWPDRTAYFVDTLARGIARIAAALHPHPVIVRMSDFKTNEYAALIGGRQFEPEEENPMLGWRGASRYYSPDYRDGFALECAAIRQAREQIGLTNIVVMIPFCRTLDEADRTLDEMAANALVRGENGLQVYVMCEIPSNVILAEEFAKRFDGFSIGSNDLTQLTLGVDRDSARLASLFQEEDPAVTTLIREVIERAHRRGRPVSFCGQAPSDRPGFAELLVRVGIDSMSVTPDSFLRVKVQVATAERRPDGEVFAGVSRSLQGSGASL